MAHSSFGRENFAKFFESPSREGLRELLRDNRGEFLDFDFKEQWPPDDTSLAKHILAMANTRGGVTVAGVRENADGTHESIGLTGSVEKEDIHKKVRKYLPSVLCDMYDIQDFSFEE